MKYLKLFENFQNSPLLNLKGNEDTNLISEISSLISGGNILEISCGNGSDAIKLHEMGYNVIATDYNNEYVNWANKFIKCIKHDTRDKFPFNDNQFDLTYSRLGLHYFTKDELQLIFNELARITSKYLVFSVKLVNDIHTGKVILDKTTWEELTREYFNILKSNIKTGKLYDNQSQWLEITAVKKN